MNGIYFFIPFILVVLVGLSGQLDIHADTIQKGINYDRELLSVDSDGTKHYRFITTHERVQKNGEYFDYIFTDNPNSLQVETMAGTVTLDKTTCGFSQHAGGLILNNPESQLTDSITPYYKTVNLDDWTLLNQINNAVCVASWNGSELTATKTSAVGIMKYKYVYTDGAWKTYLEAINLTALTDKVFGFDQTVDLDTDIIFFGGNQRNLDNYDGTTFDREWLENNQGKVLEFLSGYYFDFGLGWEYLDSISVFDTGINSSKIVFHYMRNNDVLLPTEALIIDPTFGYTTGTVYDARSDATTGASCLTTGTQGATASNNYFPNSGPSEPCRVFSVEWDTSIIDDDATIDSVTMRYDVDTAANPRNCDFNEMSEQPSTKASFTAMWDDVTNQGAYSGDVTYVSNTSQCTVVANQYTASLGASAINNLESLLSSDWFAVGIAPVALTKSGQTTIFSDVQLQVEYSVIPRPDAVDDLSLVSESFGTVILSWTEPGLNTGNVSGYQVNYSTPYGKPLTIIENDTGSTDTQTTITGLSLGTPYTFGVSIWTEGGNNATHPPMTWLNVTTGGNFTIGTAVFNQTNNEVLPITFETQTINDTAIFLNVTFSNAFDLACDFNYKYAINNHTYKNLDSYAVSTSLNETSFLFNNVTNEVIGVDCWDYNTGTDADYVLTISDFQLLNQIESFRNGEFGTMGKIGVFDVVTLFVVIISMIGLNRANESVGIIFNIALLGSLAWFGIIELPTVIFGVLALVMVFVITSTRKG